MHVVKQEQNCNKGRYWLCKCNVCGFERVMSTAQLTNGKFENCICKRFKPQKYEILQHRVKIFLTDDIFTICDIEDFYQYVLHKSKLCLDNRGYVVVSVGNKKFHRLIMNVTDSNLVVDHIDGNPLNNTKENLRVCKQINNSKNKAKNKNNTSGVVGVYYNKRCGKWVAEIKVNYQKICLGYFDTIEEATKIRREAELKYFKEYSIQLSRDGNYDTPRTLEEILLN